MTVHSVKRYKTMCFTISLYYFFKNYCWVAYLQQNNQHPLEVTSSIASHRFLQVTIILCVHTQSLSHQCCGCHTTREMFLTTAQEHAHTLTLLVKTFDLIDFISWSGCQDLNQHFLIRACPLKQQIKSYRPTT